MVLKFETDKKEASANHLLKFYDIVLKKPKFLCVICGLSNAVIGRKDGVYIVPITSLKP